MRMRHICSWQHQATSEKMMGIRETPYWVCFYCGKASCWARNCPHLVCWQLLSNWTSRTQKKVTAKFCQDKVGQYFKIPAPQKSLSEVVGLQAKDGWPKVTEEPRITVQVAWCPCHQVKFHPSGVFDGVKD